MMTTDTPPTTIDEALMRHVRPGDHVHFAYGQGRPQAAMNALIRAFWDSDARLTVSGGGFVQGAFGLVAGKIANRLIGSFFGENYPTAGPHPQLATYLHDRSVAFESWTLLTIVERLAASAYHLPFFPSRSLIGSDVERDLGPLVHRVADPFGGPDVVAVPPLTPDLTILHVPCAEPSGRFALAPPYGEGYLGALAARRGCIVTAERIVPDGSIPAARVHLPPGRVLATVAAPFGAHPYGMWDGGGNGEVWYREDKAFSVAARRDFRTDAMSWLEQWVLGVDGHDSYLERVGSTNLAALQRPLVLSDPPSVSTLPTNSRERLVAAGAAYIRSRVSAAGIQSVLCGVGLASLAAWTAREGSEEAFMLAAELGMHSFSPEPGDSYLFALPTMESGEGFMGTMEVLGSVVADPARACLAVYGAAEVDPTGASNSTRFAHQWLVGSGGANDIASTASECVIFVEARPGRLVEQVAFVTSPGDAVRAIVTDLGIVERVDGRFVLTHIPGASSADEAVAAFRAVCPWDVPVAEDLATMHEPTAAEVERIRSFDPDRDLLR